MAKRLNDTIAVQAMPTVGGNKSSSVSIRQIDNGYIVCKSTSDGNRYTCSETYSEKEPSIEGLSLPEPEEDSGKKIMRRTVEYLDRTRSNIKTV